MSKYFSGHAINDVFFSFEPYQQDVVAVLREQYPRWKTSFEIANELDVSEDQINKWLEAILNLPGGRDVIEERYENQLMHYRYIP